MSSDSLQTFTPYIINLKYLTLVHTNIVIVGGLCVSMRVCVSVCVCVCVCVCV